MTGGSQNSFNKFAGIAQLARASAFQAEGCEFESRFPLHFCSILSFFPLQCNCLTAID